ncbi:hypothetical protein BJ912DRAFT_934682 [Pholiota molesta]|nr:hypothetical protein BJ912DRAFT_934682 [Pholiota molesta]
MTVITVITCFTNVGKIVIYPRVCAGVVSGGPACTVVGVLTWRRWGTFAVGKGIWVDDGDGVESGLGLRPIGRERGRTHWVAVLDGASKPTKSLQRALFCAKGAGWMERILRESPFLAFSLFSLCRLMPCWHQIINHIRVVASLFPATTVPTATPSPPRLCPSRVQQLRWLEPPNTRTAASRQPARATSPPAADERERAAHPTQKPTRGGPQRVMEAPRRTRTAPTRAVVECGGAIEHGAQVHASPLSSNCANPYPQHRRPFQAGKAPQRRHLSTPTAVHAGPPNTMPAHTRRARRPSSLPAQFGGDARARRLIQTAIHPSHGAISAYAAPSAFSCDPHTYLRSFLNASAYTPGAIVRAGVTDLLAGQRASQQWSTMDHHSRPTPEKGAPQTTLHDGRGGTRMGGAHNSGTNIASGMMTQMAVVEQLTRERWRVSLSHHNTVSYLLGILQYAGFCGGETRSDGVWWALVDTCAPIAKSLNCLLFNEVPNHKNVEKAEKTVEKDLYCLVKQRPAPCSKMGNKTNCSGPKIEWTNEDRNCGNKISNSASHSWEHVI